MNSDTSPRLREFRKAPALTLPAVLSSTTRPAQHRSILRHLRVIINRTPTRDANPASWQINLLAMDQAGVETFRRASPAAVRNNSQTKSFESVVPIPRLGISPTTTVDLPETSPRLSFYPTGFTITGEFRRGWAVWLILSDAQLGSDLNLVVVLSYKFWQRYFLARSQ